MKELEKMVSDLFLQGKIDFNDEVVITNVRHKRALEKTRDSLKMVMEGIDKGVPEDFLTIDLMDVYEELGLIIGESVEEDLVNEIFGSFCMGK